MSITPITPLTIDPLGPTDDDWFEDDDTPEAEFDATCGLPCGLLGAPSKERP